MKFVQKLKLQHKILMANEIKIEVTTQNANDKCNSYKMILQRKSNFE